MTLTEKMIARVKTFDRAQNIDRELLGMILDGLITVGTKQMNGWTGLGAELTLKGKEELASTVSRPAPEQPAATPLNRETVEKALCCPKGCVREDDCFVSAPGAPVRYTRTKREREQADAIMAICAVSRPHRGDDT